MAWFKIDDAFHGHRKVRALRRARRHDAIGLWVLCGAWSSANNEDGFVPDDVVIELAGSAARAKSMLKPLLEGSPGMIKHAVKHGEGGIQLHDFADYNPTAVARESLTLKKSRAGKQGARARWGSQVPDSSTMAPAMAPANGTAEAPAYSPGPSRPDPIPTTSGLPPAGPDIGALVAEFVDHCQTRPPSQVVARIGREVKTLVADGQSVEAIRGGLTIVAERGLNPGVLPSAVHEHVNARPRRRGFPAPSEDTNNVIGMVLDVGMQ